MNSIKFRKALYNLTDEQADAVEALQPESIDVTSVGDVVTALRAVAPILRNICKLAQVFTGSRGDDLLDKVIALLDKVAPAQ